MTTRAQLHCEQCGTPTLHVQDPDSVNHVLHLLITVLLVGIWLPVWIFLAISAPIRHLRCSLCGHASTDKTKEELAAATRESIELNRQYEASRRAAEAKARSKRMHAAIGSIGWAIGTTANGISSAWRSAVGSVDAALRNATGDDAFMLWMLRVMVILVGSSAAGAAVYATARVTGIV